MHGWRKGRLKSVSRWNNEYRASLIIILEKSALTLILPLVIFSQLRPNRRPWRIDNTKSNLLKFKLGSETKAHPMRVWGMNKNFTLVSSKTSESTSRLKNE